MYVNLITPQHKWVKFYNVILSMCTIINDNNNKNINPFASILHILGHWVSSSPVSQFIICKVYNYIFDALASNRNNQAICFKIT